MTREIKLLSLIVQIKMVKGHIYIYLLKRIYELERQLFVLHVEMGYATYISQRISID